LAGPPPQAYYSSRSLPSEENWYPDTFDTHHLTNDLQNLNLSSEEYTGQDQIRIGNGKCLSIKHSSSASITLSHHKFLLKQLLHVPHICRNLLSVHQFPHNFVFFEFYPSHFVIKDCKTEIQIHQGQFQNGLYQLFPSHVHPSIPQALVGERTSSQCWHKRLGHPALRIVNLILSKFQLPVSNNKALHLAQPVLRPRGINCHFLFQLQVFLILWNYFIRIFGDLPQTLSLKGNRYYVSFVDAFSRFTWVYPMQSKSEVMPIFLKFQTMIERLLNAKIKSVQTD